MSHSAMKSIIAAMAVQMTVLATEPIRILPIGDSITRGSYLAKHEDGTTFGLPHSGNGGWRSDLQSKLRAAGIDFDFVGPVSYCASTDKGFDPDHCGLAGFSAAQIIKGGEVPTPADVLKEMGVAKIVVPGAMEIADRFKPDVVLLMVGSNGFDAPKVAKLIRMLAAWSACDLFVATIPPQKPPRSGWESVDGFNADLTSVVTGIRLAFPRVHLVDVHSVMTEDDILADGVHPTRSGMTKIADAWFRALEPVLRGRK